MPQHPATSPVESLKAGVRQRQVSPLAVPAWWRFRCALLGTALCAILGLVPGWGGNLLAAVTGGTAVVCVARWAITALESLPATVH